ncbi:MAG: glycosyltransferase family 39 protein [Chitinophagaceae bacterium]|nr:glycosyltransferase family 39 protein [Chitinophagaceae bacterium]MCW5925862.1 glycosyltransferase family 39 protein [Chitinophagaceae bacterium]
MGERKVLLLFAGFIAVYFCAVGVDTIDIDASQYASISREMKETGNYLQVYEAGKDYLDKPPFLFWASALSMKVFGDNNFAYKLPSILFAIAAVFALFRFTVLFYDRRLAVLSAIVLASCQAFFLITNDIRTDTILMSWVIIAVWQIAEWYRSQKIIHFVLGAAAIGCGMLAKGPIALLVPVFAFGSHFILKKQFRYLFRPVYLLGLVVIAIVLIPMSIGLYQQFDLHPEKTVHGSTGVSGLRFFYWTQSFGRITGESAWNNNATFGFQFQNLLWGMLPWTLFFVTGLAYELIRLIRNRLKTGSHEELISTGGFVLAYCSLGLSKYQLPHYIYVVLPFIALITAKMIDAMFWQNKFPRLRKLLTPLQWIICAAMIILPVLILCFVFPGGIWPWVAPIGSLLIALLLLFNKQVNKKVFQVSLMLVIGLNIFLSVWFYPNLLKYQAGNTAGRFVSSNRVSEDKFFRYRFLGNDWSLNFYSKRIVQDVSRFDGLESGTYLLTMEEGLDEINESGRPFEIAFQGLDFKVSILTAKFLNKERRESQCKKYFVVLLK